MTRFEEKQLQQFSLRSAIWLCLLSWLISPALAQDLEGEALFKTHCALCHESADSSHAPPVSVLRNLTAEQVLNAMEKGSMQFQAQERSRTEKRALAEYVSGKAFGPAPVDMPESAYCPKDQTKAPAELSEIAWNGWGADMKNTRFQPEAIGGITAKDLPRLKLKWAFGLPGASSGGTQPVVVGGRVYVGDNEGDLFSIDAETGCAYWRVKVEAGIRSAIVIQKRKDGKLAAFFGDQIGNVYAVDAETGKTLWTVRADENPQSAVTGGLAYHDGRVFVGTSSREEAKATDPTYPCCFARGNLIAFDIESGAQIWKTSFIEEEPRPGKTNSVGTVIYGPSGAPVWSTPTIDLKRRVIYVGTGNNISPPASRLSDSIVALDLDTGEILWHRQQTEQDIWSLNCRSPDREPAICPDPKAPDYDFSVSPPLVNLDGKQLLIAANKSGIVWALDPDNNGELVWEQQVGLGSTRGGVLFGIAVEKDKVFVPNAFLNEQEPEKSGDMSALDLRTGDYIWRTPNPPCADPKRCRPTHAAAVTAIPGAVFSGTMDGWLYAYSASTGEIIWSYDTAREFRTVNSVKANGGSMSNGGPVTVGGMMFVQSGYSHHGAILPGNVLLAFEKD